MKINISFKVIALGLAAIIVLTAVVLFQRKRAGVAAYVGSEAIYMAPIDKRIENLRKVDPGRFSDAQGAQEEAGLRRTLLEEQIAAKAAGQVAFNSGIRVSDAEVNAAIDKVIASSGGKARFEKQLVEDGLTEEMFRNARRDQIAITKMSVKVAKETRVTPGEVAAYIEQNKQEFEQPSAQVNISIITVADQDALKKTLSALKKGADFDALAGQVSIDKKTGPRWQLESFLGPGALKSVQALAVGAYTTNHNPNPDQTLSIYKLHDRQVRLSTAEERAQQVEAKLLILKQENASGVWFREAYQKAQVQRNI